MAKTSAGLLVYRFPDDQAEGPRLPEVLIVHPGGPLWAKKDEGAWSIPKGEYEPGDDAAECARREFSEELGIDAPEGTWSDLGEVTQSGGKRVRAWAVLADIEDIDTHKIRSNTFEMQWPPRSGRVQSFPEIDRAAWVSVEVARRKLVPAQAEFLERLLAQVETEP